MVECASGTIPRPPVVVWLSLKARGVGPQPDLRAQPRLPIPDAW